MPIPRWAERARLTPDAPAIVTRETTWTCADVASAIAARAASLRGDRPLTLDGGVSIETTLDLLAAIEARIPVVMNHPRWTQAEREAVRARLAGSHPPHTVLAVLATSGTTGIPKLAVLSRRAFAAAANASALHLGASAEDRWLLAMPLAHVGGLGVVVRSLVQCTPLVLHDGDPSGWIPLARSARVTHVSLVPTLLARLLDRGEALPPSVRVLLVGGAACPESVLARALGAGLPVRPTYGLTETCGQVATATGDPRALVPLPGVDVRVEGGTIRVRSASAMDGWVDEAATPFDADGFYDTGDLGELDARGRLHVHARRTDLVVSGGENVYPREVEEALERIPGIRAACVFGVPDPEWGQRVAAAIVTEPSAPSDDAIIARARVTLAGFKLPRLLARLDTLAIAESGKLDRRRTAARALTHLRSAGRKEEGGR